MDFVTFLRAHWDRAAATSLLIVAVIALILGYLGASGTPFTAEQIPYIVSGAVTAVFLLGLAATLYLSADLRDEWRKLADIDDHLVELGAVGNQRPQETTHQERVEEAEPVRRPSRRSSNGAAQS